jgi:hypothetical protein
MKNSLTSLVVLTFLALSAVETSAFVKGSSRSSPVRTSKPALMEPLYAVTKKAAAPKAAAKKGAAAKKAPAKKKAAADAPENLKKAEFVASVAEKTGMTKVAAEEALTAVLDTITEVRID